MSETYDIDAEIRDLGNKVTDMMGHIAEHWSADVQFQRQQRGDVLASWWYVHFNERDGLPECESCSQTIKRAPQPQMIMEMTAKRVLEIAERDFRETSNVGTD